MAFYAGIRNISRTGFAVFSLLAEAAFD